MGNLELGSFTRDFERLTKGTLEMECLSLRELCEGNLEGAPSLGMPKDMLSNGHLFP